MDKELKHRWVEALRSGKYQQTRQKLRESNEFCCLGVLCDVDDPNGWDGDTFVAHDGMEFYSVLPDSLRAKAGLSKDDETHLALLNDEMFEPFHKIADYIETNL